MTLVDTESEDYLKAIILEKEDELGYPICGARNRQGVPCSNKAGKGVPGLLGTAGIRCKFHGGRNQLPSAKTFKHGKYSRVKTEHPELRKMMEVLAADHDVFDLEQEIIRQRAIMEILANKGDLLGSAKMAVDISKVVERYHNIMEGRKYVISIENVSALQQYVIDTINRHVTDSAQRHAIAQDLLRYRVSTISRPKAIAGQYEAVEEE